MRLPEHRVFPLLIAAGVALLAVGAGHAQTIVDAQQLHLSGRFDEALEAYRVVAAASEESEPGVAAAAHNNSCLIYLDRSDYDRALASCEAALRLHRQVGDDTRTARTLNNLGLALQSLGRYDESEARYDEALEINRSAGNLGSAAQNLINLSGVAIQAGRYARALERTAAVVELTDAHPQAEWRTTQRRNALINEGVVLEKLGAFRAALDSYRAALNVEGPIEPGIEAALTVNLGVVYRNLGDPLRAVELFEQAEAVYKRLGNASGRSNALLNIALARHLNLAEQGAAETAYRAALDLAVTAGDKPEEVQDLFYLGSLLLESDRETEAEELFERALQVSEESGSSEGQWASLAGLGRVAAASGRLGEASAYFDRALEVIEAVRSDLSTGSHRADFFSDKRDVFEAAVQAAVDLDEREPAAGHAASGFRLVQRAKARELLDALGERSGGQPLGATEIAAGLGNDLLLEYFVAERDLVRWSLDGRGLRLSNLGPARPILDLVLEVHAALSGGGAPDTRDLERLANDLLKGVDPPAGGQLYLAADGALRYLPFELLPVGGDGEQLLDRSTVAYLPSGSAHAYLETGEAPRELQSVALANPLITTSSTTPLGPTALLAARFDLRALPAAEAEVASLERWLGGPSTRLIGAQATEAAFRDSTARGARVVHLATHAVIDERPARGAAVLLTAAGDDDGLLYPQEIAALELDTDLAVLAACRTALGPDAGGSSLATLTGAFLAAGARSVVATLWDVGDSPTATFMDQFYWQLGRGASPAEALRLAKLELRGRPDWSSPHLWAGYVLTGSAPPVAESTLKWWILGGLAVVAAGAMMFRRRR